MGFWHVGTIPPDAADTKTQRRVQETARVGDHLRVNGDEPQLPPCNSTE
jgi:hypothetical protein